MVVSTLRHGARAWFMEMCMEYGAVGSQTVLWLVKTAYFETSVCFP